MSNEEEYERLRNYLLQAQDLVGQKLEPKEGFYFALEKKGTNV